jgi:ATP-binding cassette subfamily F protein uup
VAFVSLLDLTIGFSTAPLLDGVTCQIEAGQRIGLLGRNGSGKTTLLRALAGQVEPDHGQVLLAQGTRVALLPQDVPYDLEGSIVQVVRQGLPSCSDEPDKAWQAHRRLESILSRMQLDGEADFASLSSGMKRRGLLARALVAEPELLLLDEPTNHLDIGAITWLEDFLGRWPGTFIFVTHDRRFLRNLATRILEIDRGRLFDWSCDYETFLRRKEEALAAEEKQNDLFDKRLAQEEAWIRQGIKARRTRNEGRVRALEAMRRKREERRSRPGQAKIEIHQGQRSGNLVAEVQGVSFAYSERPILRDFSTTILRGDKIGIVGPNGAGKTTLLRILLGQQPPQRGSVRLGTNLQIAYFDQLREQLNDEETVHYNVGDGYDTVQLGSKPRHILSYLQDFLFTPDRSRTPVKFLSGGERNRVLLAKLFAKPANVLVLDEPTNDLDTETLELLEERLVQFAGTVLLVSHDREFLSNVVTSTIVFEETLVKEYVGGYDDWLRQRPEPKGTVPASMEQDRSMATEAAAPQNAQTNLRGSGERKVPPRRLSYNEQRELAQLPARIEALESELTAIHANMAEASFYQKSSETIAREAARLKVLEAQLTTAYQRWEELEAV